MVSVDFPKSILLALLGLFQSKRVLMTLIGLVVAILVSVIPALVDYEQALLEILVIVGVFIISQVFPDWGVEKIAQKYSISAREFKTKFWESKKVATALVAMIVAVILHFFPTVPEEAISAVVLAFVAIIGSQGLIDTGKEAAKIKAVYS